MRCITVQLTFRSGTFRDFFLSYVLTVVFFCHSLGLESEINQADITWKLSGIIESGSFIWLHFLSVQLQNTVKKTQLTHRLWAPTSCHHELKPCYVYNICSSDFWACSVVLIWIHDDLWWSQFQKPFCLCVTSLLYKYNANPAAAAAKPYPVRGDNGDLWLMIKVCLCQLNKRDWCLQLFQNKVDAIFLQT